MTKMKLIIFIAIIPVLFISACNSSKELGDDLEFVKGDYTYNLLDSSGKKLASGSFVIAEINGKDVSGTYSFDEMFVNDFPGRESMTGKFSGQLGADNKTLWINTNPKLSDNNVFMNITAGKFSYLGEWRFSTMRGSVGTGKIQLFKK